MTPRQRRESNSRRPPTSPHRVGRLDRLAREVERLGLNEYEARVLIALLGLGSANTIDLASESGVPRTSIYQVLTALAARRLAERLPLDGPAIWTTPGGEEVLQRLDTALEAAQHEQLRQHRQVADEVSRVLAERLPEPASVSLPFVKFLRGAAHLKRTWEHLLQHAEHELLMFTRSPYAWKVGSPNSVVLDTLARGVRTRVLYESADWTGPSATALRRELDAYHRAGVEARLVASLPIKLSIIDRRVSLIGVPELDDAFPSTIQIDSDRVSHVLVEAFERYWESGRPLPSPARGRTTRERTVSPDGAGGTRPRRPASRAAKLRQPARSRATRTPR